MSKAILGLALLLAACADTQASQCVEHVEMVSIERWAEHARAPGPYFGREEIPLTSKSGGGGTGRVMGRIAPGAYGRILEQDGRTYNIESCRDGATGWTSHVYRIVRRTADGCQPCD